MSDYKSELSTRLEQIKELKLTLSYISLQEQNGHLQDRWVVAVVYNNQSYSTEYGSGIGNRKLEPYVIVRNGGYYKKVTGEFKTDKEACLAGWLKPVPPTVIDVVGCLLVDSSCADGTFEDFCSNLGYNTDSRKDLDTYLACQKTHSALIKMFGRELFEELSCLEH